MNENGTRTNDLACVISLGTIFIESTKFDSHEILDENPNPHEISVE